MIRNWLLLVHSGLRTVLTAPAPQAWARARFLLLFVLVLPVVVAVARICMALDHVVYPGFRRRRVRGPLFIVGNFRTGTTRLHRLLARDTRGIATLTVADMFFPSVLQKRALRRLGQVDRLLGSPVRRLLIWLDSRTTPGYRHIHPMGLWEPEEDEYVLLLHLASASQAILFPDVERFHVLQRVDDRMAPAERTSLLARYRELVQRHLHHVGGDPLWLAKNPNFTWKIDALAEAFPDARFLYLTRSPLSVIPSTASLLHYVWWTTGVLPPGVPDPATILEWTGSLYRDGARRIAALGDRATVVEYEDLLADPHGSVRRAFAALGLPVGPGLEAVLTFDRDHGDGFENRHRYTGGDFGLDPDTIHAALADVFEAWGYAPPRPAEEAG